MRDAVGWTKHVTYHCTTVLEEQTPTCPYAMMIHLHNTADVVQQNVHPPNAPNASYIPLACLAMVRSWRLKRLALPAPTLSLRNLCILYVVAVGPETFMPVFWYPAWVRKARSPVANEQTRY